ncbi:MAG: hypothetical protein A3K30_03925 [Deltaproteobacteria bacterium RBG_13_51_10]|nr:MAG: hypothetical protein A3K30_03925 [Deltaproteobacteria bacterium RBG_13_51_10]
MEIEVEIKAKYDGKDIAYLEKQVEDNRSLSRESQKEMFLILYYLKLYGGYKKNKRYAKTSFYNYIEDRFLIREGTYNEMQRAYVKFPVQSVEYGVGVVSKILRVCGPIRTKETFTEMDKANEQKTINRATIEKIIQKHKDPERVKEASEHKDYKNLYEKLLTVYEKTKESLKEAIAQIKELEEQNKRLKETVKKYSEIRRIVGQSKEQPASAI